MRWSIGARSLATAATANHCGFQFWNPSTSRPVWVTAISFAQTGAIVSNPALKRSTVRGATPTGTNTPTIANDWDRMLIPPTLSVLETGTFGTQPTLEGVDLFKWNLPAAIGSGFMTQFETKDLHGIEVLPGSGLCIYTPVAVILQPADCTFNLFE